MPIYEYHCDSCEELFTEYKSIMDYKMPSDCPTCGSSAKRAIVSAPGLNSMNPALRKAHQTNEKSAHEPKVRNSGHGHTCTSSCNHGHQKNQPEAPKLKQQNGRRPWMLGH